MRKIVLIVTMLFLSSYVFAAKIDLSISSSDVTVSPSQPKPNDSVTVTVKVHSIGSKPSKPSVVKLKIKKGSSKVFAQKNSIPAIPVGESYDTIFNVGSLQEGTYTLLIKVDPANAIPETNEGNNRVQLSLVVSSSSSNGFAGVAGGALSLGMGSSLFIIDETNSYPSNENLRKPVLTLLKILKNIKNIDNFFKTELETCSKSGSYDYTISYDSYFRPNKIEIKYYNCQEFTDNGGYTELDGDSSIEIGYLSDDPFSPDFQTVSTMVLKMGDGDPSVDTSRDLVKTEYNSSNSPSYKSQSDLAMAMEILEYQNGPPYRMAISLNGVVSEIDYSTSVTSTLTFNNLHYDITMSCSDNGDCSVDATISGTISFTNSSDSTQSFTATYQNFVIHLIMMQSMMEIEWGVTGVVDVTSSCFSGSISFETIENVTISEHSDCPTSGKIKVTTSSEQAIIIFNPDGSISVDIGANGTIDFTFSNCDELSYKVC